MTHDEMRDFAQRCLGSADTGKSLLADCVLRLLAGQSASPGVEPAAPPEGPQDDRKACNCGADICIQQRNLLPGYVCVRVVGLAALSASRIERAWRCFREQVAALATAHPSSPPTPEPAAPRDGLRKLAEMTLCVRLSNTPEFMELLAETLTVAAKDLGESVRVTFDGHDGFHQDETPPAACGAASQEPTP